ncbi:RagB/SusD family nutrient uptake outer membrane protein [Hymenobacter chitinivorans]|uniref:Putative outer membrane starch-binding protein n=1 Tax=Hymenobacter chitinivorans DSM 11115 TaxID=1121954 RepID=A0A2M9BPU1_9BACT|nr:RagB/SusD family nutrient uptake outer membrane protein [Hymenobacter chitinivorans]PJJ59922.1 putative outer membrane starch-binding protein [Hymenobacter chitinivorans DSM 11115]
MKNRYTTLAAALLLTLSACEKDLDQAPLSSGSVPTFYQTPNDFDQALTATYAGLVAYPDRLYNLSEMRSDNIYGVGEAGVRDWEPINNFQTTLATNPYIAEAWTTNYNAILRANTVLDQLAGTNGSVLSAAVRSRTEGEAKFLRAFYYFDLVRTFGRVPLIDKALVPSEVLKVPRTPVAQVYELIISDLQTAIANLPLIYDNAVTADKGSVGRATASAAKALLALVYLTRSGPTYGIQGPGLGSNEYGKAATLLNEIIASGKFGFVPKYADIFSYTNENNREVIFDVQYISGGTGRGGTLPTLVSPGVYFAAVKIPFAGAEEIKPVANDLLNSYPTGDGRKDFNFQMGYTTLTNIKETRAFERKYLNETLRGVDRFDWPINFIVLRYTDVLLMRAECILHGAGGTPADVDAAVNQVRSRAGLGPITGVTLAQLLEERRREFAGEGLRWHDLVREGVVLDVMNAWIPKEDTRNKITRNISANSIIYPIPQAELSAAPGLYDQNPGY